MFFCIIYFIYGVIRIMKFSIVLSGCGQFDGSETHEVVLTLLSLSQNKIEWDAFAPDIEQSQVFNHLKNEIQQDEKRQVLDESARLVRGRVKSITNANISDYDAVIFPGGFGAVSNLCNWGTKGMDFDFNPDVEKFIIAAKNHNKPMGFICIAPVMIPKIFSKSKLTIGNDPDISKKIELCGATHINCNALDVVVDYQNKVVSTPANMVAKGIDEVYQGIYKLVQALRNLAENSER